MSALRGMCTVLCRISFVALCLALLSPSHAEGGRSLATREVHFTTDEGTWMSLDVAPDGRTIAFNLLGQLYTIPIEGGRAQPLAHHAWAVDERPRFSPDGRSIAFISDRGGNRKPWLVDLASGATRRVEDGDTTADLVGVGRDVPQEFRSVRWLPSGKELLLTRLSFPSISRLVVLDVVAGRHRPFHDSVAGIHQPVHSAAIAPDGRTAFVGLGRHTSRPRPTVEFRLYRLDLTTGEAKPFTQPNAPYHEYKPELSRTGRWLAYVRHYDGKRSELRVYDSRKDVDRMLMPLSDADEPHRLTLEDEFPNYAFTPDEHHIVIWSGGKLHKVDVESGKSAIIPFIADVRRTVNAPLESDFPLPDDVLTVRALRWPQVSIDEKMLVFSALGDLWSRELPDGQPHRLLATDTHLELMPALSPDAKSIAYVSFEIEKSRIKEPGRLRVLDLRTRAVRELGEPGASYAVPTWSADGRFLAVIRQSHVDNAEASKTELGWIDLRDAKFHSVATVMHDYGFNTVRYPGLVPDGQTRLLDVLAWSADGHEILFQDVQDEAVVLRAVHRKDKSIRTIASAELKFVEGMLPSPSMKHIVLRGRDQQAYVARLRAAQPSPPHLRLDAPGVRRVSAVGALHPQWQVGDKFVFGYMDEVFAYRVGDAAASRLTKTHLEVPRRQGSGRFAIRGARIITSSEDHIVPEIIESGTIVVNNRRVEAIGPADSTVIPADARVVDGSGLTLMPGIVDVHYHGPFWTGQRIYRSQLPAALAYGITTPFDPGSAPQDDGALAWQELLETGVVLGVRGLADPGASYTLAPRLTSPLSALEQVRQGIERKRIMGAGPCLKNLSHKNRLQLRRQVQAAHEQKFCYVGHTDDIAEALAYMIDGVAIHHWALPSSSYRDIEQMMVQSGVIWSPHFSCAGAVSHKQFSSVRRTIEDIYLHLPPEATKKLERFYGEAGEMPLHGAMVDLLHQPVIDFDETWSGAATRNAVELMRKGVRVAISGDTHWSADLRAEMHLFQEAGLSPLEIIRSVTLTNAEELGLAGDLGSLEPGKIADFLVLTANPLENILNTMLIKWTVIDGVIYDVERMEAVDPS